MIPTVTFVSNINVSMYKYNIKEGTKIPFKRQISNINETYQIIASNEHICEKQLRKHRSKLRSYIYYC